MSDTSHIAKLPTRIDDKAAYVLKGETLRLIRDLLTSLWGGRNIDTGPGVFKAGVHHGGVLLSARTRSSASASPCWLSGVQYWKSPAQVAEAKAAAATPDHPNPDLRAKADVFATTRFDLSGD